VDIFKDGISVPGLVLKYMFQDLLDYFTLPTRRTSIVFHRYHERDETTIRSTDYEEPNTCKRIIGYDANALYLWSIMQEMPTGHFVRRKSENQFRRETPRRYEWMAIEWLEWEAKNTGCHVSYQGNQKRRCLIESMYV
jgi:hypothetical protein